MNDMTDRLFIPIHFKTVYLSNSDYSGYLLLIVKSLIVCHSYQDFNYLFVKANENVKNLLESTSRYSLSNKSNI